MAIRIENAVAQDRSGTWVARTIKVVQCWRVRVVSGKSLGKAHQFGHGEEFEVAIDVDLELWTRVLGTDHAFRKEADAYGVSLLVGDNITGGIVHEVTIQRRPGDELARWICSCNAGARGWTDPEEAQREADEHQGKPAGDCQDPGDG